MLNIKNSSNHQKSEKPTYKIIKTLSEDYCIIESLKDPVGVKLISFDELESGRIVWEGREILRQMAIQDRKAEAEKLQKISQMNKGRKSSH